MSLNNKVDDFLRKYRMHPENIDIEKISNIFLEEMRRGLTGKPSTLAMIPTYIEPTTSVERNKRVLVLDAGGTNFRVATVYFGDDYKPVIEKFARFSMPGSKSPVSKKEFFNTIVDYIVKTGNIEEKVGFCFSYPTEILPNKDGRLIQFCKEVIAPEVEGELIGEGLKEALKDRGLKSDVKIVLMNDTVATLLAGLASYREKVYDNYIGFILGTGTNCCYVEKNSEIKKLKGLNINAEQIVNVESGAFGKVPRGLIDESLDKKTVDPGDYRFEKMISGGYFGLLCLETFKFAAKDKLFSKTLSKHILKLEKLETKDINDFYSNPIEENLFLSDILKKYSNIDDYRALYFIIDRLIERAAKLTAINIGSVILKTDSGDDPLHPILITAEGTTFYGLKSLKDRVLCYLKNFINDEKNRYFEVVNVENATLIGSAIAGLTN